MNRLRYGERTWIDECRHKFAIFNQQEAAAIAAYLKLKARTDEYQRPAIEEALRNYWIERAER